MSPGERAAVDQLRAGIAEALRTPCDCGRCISDDVLRDMAAADDDALLLCIQDAQ